MESGGWKGKSSLSPFFVVFFISVAPVAMAQESHRELVIRAWEALGSKNYTAVYDYVERCIASAKDQAQGQQASLKGFPTQGTEENYSALNDVGAAYFIKGEALFQQGKLDEAKEAYLAAIEQYGFAQCWDPRGWYWKVAEKARESLRKISRPQGEGRELPRTRPVAERKVTSRLVLNDPGSEELIDYNKYGEFVGVGTKDYKYKVTDQEGLAKAVGEGIYPNTNSVLYDPAYRRLRERGRLKGNHWDFIHSDDKAANFYKWATAAESAGVKLFYTALALEEAGLLRHAIKAYYALIVHYPGSVGWTYWHTPWYVSKVAIDKVYFITRRHPELGIRLEGAKVAIENGFDNDVANDVVLANPGRLVKEPKAPAVWDSTRLWLKEKGILKRNKAPSESLGLFKRLIGKADSRVKLVQYENGHWQLLVEDKPFLIKGVSYSPTKVGQSPDEGTLEDWMQSDHNKNGKIDGPYDAYVKPGEPVGDFALMKAMGVNTVRLYHHASNKDMLRDIYEKYGIMFLMGDFLGAYAIGSGAGWYEGTDYTNPTHQANMLESVKEMVLEFKDEPYVLLWVLGNENNYGVANNAKKNPEAYYKFVNEAARLIKSLDPNHPVALCNGDLLFLDIFARNCLDVDVFGTNSYRGESGFTHAIWEDAQDAIGRAVFITEFGCPALHEGKAPEEGEKGQARYHRGAWEGIEYNSAGSGIGNSLGGVVFEWVDEWWKAYEPSKHDWKGLFTGSFPDGYMHEEWLGICGQGDGTQSPFFRELRQAYYMYQRLWKNRDRHQLKF